MDSLKKKIELGKCSKCSRSGRFEDCGLTWCGYHAPSLIRARYGGYTSTAISKQHAHLLQVGIGKLVLKAMTSDKLEEWHTPLDKLR